MKAPKLFVSMLTCAAVVGSFAQNIPTHDSYVMPFEEGKQRNFSAYFTQWDPQNPLSEDENFYISRVPLKKRFVNTATQVDPNMTQDRKFCMWTPWVYLTPIGSRCPAMYSMATTSTYGPM